jgi:hypothetical protein
MESVTLQEFNKQAGKAIIILVIFIGFSIYRIVKNTYNLDHFVIIGVSVSGIFGIRRLLLIAEQRIEFGIRKMKTWETVLLEQILIFGLGILSIYIFAAKGAYGTYLLFRQFDFKILLYRLAIIIISYQLVVAVNKIQIVFKAIESATD